jgi:hypothetical protein
MPEASTTAKTTKPIYWAKSGVKYTLFNKITVFYSFLSIKRGGMELLLCGNEERKHVACRIGPISQTS